MPWLQLILECPEEDAELLSELLSAQGASAVTFLDSADQPLFEPPVGTTPLWHQTRVIGLFSAEANLQAVITNIEQTVAPNPPPPARIEQLEDRDWTREWLNRFKPMQFGQNLWIIPTGYTPPEPAATNILLDPGLAFGTGTHPTTRLCLEWLDAHGSSDLNVIDYGCGSGILAIAAARLGAKQVLGVDNDPQALTATRDNAEQNGMLGQIKVFLPDELPAGQCDLLLANILAQPLISLAPHFAERVKTGGQIVLSGILPEQADAVRHAYLQWFDMEPVVEHDGWVRLTGKRLQEQP